jgi:splicing suppressor protein 51
MIRGGTTLTRLSQRPSALPSVRRIEVSRRTFFWPFRRIPTTPTSKPSAAATVTTPLLAQNDLFHPLSQSPFPALVDKANRIKNVSLCPTSLEKHDERTRPAFDCPDCGWPTHASQSRWIEGKEEHQEYCGRLREVNEDEHDIRSGRNMNEFENLPGMSCLLMERSDKLAWRQAASRNEPELTE